MPLSILYQCCNDWDTQEAKQKPAHPAPSQYATDMQAMKTELASIKKLMRVGHGTNALGPEAPPWTPADGRGGRGGRDGRGSRDGRFGRDGPAGRAGRGDGPYPARFCPDGHGAGRGDRPHPGGGQRTNAYQASDPTHELGAHSVAPYITCLLYTSPSPRDRTRSRMPSSA